jgi:hypothetical protein
VEPRLSRSEVQRWLVGQRESDKVIRTQRLRGLLSLTPEKAWEIYLSLPDSRFGVQRDTSKPSYVLAAMRRVLDRQARRKQSHT